MTLDQATLDHCKAWIDYRCAGLRSQIGPLDEKSIVKVLTVDVAMAVLAHNHLHGLRSMLDSQQTPKFYHPSPRIYIHDDDMEQLRHLTEAWSAEQFSAEVKKADNDKTKC